MSTEEKKKKVNSFYKSLIFYIIFIIFWTFFGLASIKRITPRGTPKACFSNCRVIMGGIEMYNMDHKEDYISEYIPLNPSGTPLEGYYMPITKPRAECEYLYDSDNSEVFCKLHGRLANAEEVIRKYESDFRKWIYTIDCEERFRDALIMVSVFILIKFLISSFGLMLKKI